MLEPTIVLRKTTLGFAHAARNAADAPGTRFAQPSGILQQHAGKETSAAGTCCGAPPTRDRNVFSEQTQTGRGAVPPNF